MAIDCSILNWLAVTECDLDRNTSETTLKVVLIKWTFRTFQYQASGSNSKLKFKKLEEPCTKNLKWTDLKIFLSLVGISKISKLAI